MFYLTWLETWAHLLGHRLNEGNWNQMARLDVYSKDKDTENRRWYSDFYSTKFALLFFITLHLYHKANKEA